jgi:Na+-translocating ferredoxin:NAD+ oxidoreductase RNF subunit RnfB
MSSILLAVAIVSGIGLVAGVGLAIADALMREPVDDRARRLAEALPGYNCGACGHPGCAGYAGAMHAGAAPCNLCTPGGDAVAQALAAILETRAEAVVPRKALVRCNGTHENCKQAHEYGGEPTCAAAALAGGGWKLCAYGCLGFGDCVRACPNAAMHMEDGVARVDQEKCHGCSICERACPREIIVMKETVGKAINRCCSREAGPAARKLCACACVGCRLCAKNCPEQAIAIENNLARVDPEKCTGCGLCISKCPTKSLVMS